MCTWSETNHSTPLQIKATYTHLHDCTIINSDVHVYLLGVDLVVVIIPVR